ncbi:DNA (cytosine-5-)-methyltransferase [Candidatus Woesebacteria bacterium]|nr:DNA (cytosine-5-)-methyltransferase [Candidatus Woesebacteria bacterium]
MKFIDLFAGLGGFHIGLEALGHKCVFACDLDKNLAELYEKNFNIKVSGDIKKINVKDIPKHDILCAGFPCQPFSIAGRQHGLKDTERGTLFVNDIVRILKYHDTPYVLLENVRNILKHDKGNTWEIIIKALTETLNYNVQFKILSPHQYGIPQIRHRVFIVASKKSLSNFNWPTEINNPHLDIRDILDTEHKSIRLLPEREKEAINVWQEFIDCIPEAVPLPSFPIWAMEYNCTYPFETGTPYTYSQKELEKYKGAFGVSLKGLSKEAQLACLPTYANHEVKNFPQWKIDFILKNRMFFQAYKKELSLVMEKIAKLPHSWQKLEWNCQGEERNINKYILQFRASGIRVKRTAFSPSLVASTATQTPIIAWESRYMSVHEAAKLQSMDNITMPESITGAFRALGNAVNARLVYLVAKNLLPPMPQNKSSNFIKETNNLIAPI